MAVVELEVLVESNITANFHAGADTLLSEGLYRQVDSMHMHHDRAKAELEVICTLLKLGVTMCKSRVRAGSSEPSSTVSPEAGAVASATA